MILFVKNYRFHPNFHQKLSELWDVCYSFALRLWNFKVLPKFVRINWLKSNKVDSTRQSNGSLKIVCPRPGILQFVYRAHCTKFCLLIIFSMYMIPVLSDVYVYSSFISFLHCLSDPYRFFIYKPANHYT